MPTRLQRRAFEVLQIPSAPGDRLGKAFDIVIVSLILLNTAAVIFETVDGLTDRYTQWLQLFEWASVVVFTIEYALRAWSIVANPRYADPVAGRLRWSVTPYAIIDLLAILPALLFVFDLRFLRVLRVLRILKLGRYSESVHILGSVLRRSAGSLGMSLFLVVLALILTSSFMYYAERDAQPEVFGSIPSAMWWSIIALTTTGYGDIVPVTIVGRALAGVTALLGVATIALPVGILSSSFVTEVEARRREASNECPHCGKALKSDHPDAQP